MSSNRTRRPYGTGSLIVRRQAWYGQWRVNGRIVKRKLGPRRESGSPHGLTRSQAERELRRRMEEVVVTRVCSGRTVATIGETYISYLERVLGRKPTTISDYGSILRRHLAPFFGDKPAERIKPDQVACYLIHSLEAGLSAKTVSNHMAFAHGIFAFAVKRGWLETNPVSGVDRPRSDSTDPDIRFLDDAELEALIRSVPEDALGPTDRVLYLTAAMTGLRQGELLALRWRDVDWVGGVVRVRRSITRGKLGTPKSRRSHRAVPLATRLTSELDKHFTRSHYQADDDLVLCHPETGHPLDPSRLRKRFKAALRLAGVRTIRFHDLRHTFGTTMAGVGVPMRTLQEWMGHRDFGTTLIYAHYSPSPHREREWVEKAFGGAGESASLFPESVAMSVGRDAA